jgi:hypothetical protein
MAVLDLEKDQAFLPAIPLGEERLDNAKLYKRRGCVEKPKLDLYCL